MHKDLSEFDIPQLALHPSSNNFWEHKKCFRKCVKDMKTAFFDEKEESCSSKKQLITFYI